jgi:hypothetical protein
MDLGALLQVPYILYFNWYLDRILLLSNWIGPKARDMAPKRYCQKYNYCAAVFTFDWSKNHKPTPRYNLIATVYILGCHRAWQIFCTEQTFGKILSS